MNLDLSNKNALVCGSSQGIGKAIALELAALGANVTLLARNESRLQAALEDLSSPNGQKHDYLVADFSDQLTLKNTVEQAVKSKTFHILINNTGGPPGGLIHEAKLEEFVAAFQMHLLGNHILTQGVVPGMKAEGYGRIINIISTSVKQPLDGLGVSNTTRGAVANWAKTMANELGQFGITVNNVLPGATSTGRLESIIQSKANKAQTETATIETKMKSGIPARRFAKPAEVAAAAAFLASPAAAYINGVNLPVDGGRTKSL